MLNLIICEFKKLKRKKIFSFALLAAFIFPALGSALIAGQPNAAFDDMMSFAREESNFLLLMPLLIILAANLFFTEQDNDTLKNLLCIPVSKKRLVLVKLLVLLIFSIVFQIVGFAISTAMTVLYHIPLTDITLQLILMAAMAVLLWAAALPCIVLVLWFNKSYILSVIIVFFYTLLNYAMHFSEAILVQPLGFNVGTLMPIPMIFRWLYQFNTPTGEIQTAFYNRFSPYFASTSVCFCVLLIEASVCTLLMIRIYQSKEI
ncbi:bacitracin transport system permease protein [Anaerovirgula multivorans]|uniref:Bacitracin transport system permease protein n=1 Tax=Anaerovirgula multivorans TaxID=312168 RepID=A0A239I3J6_9FIRM|nr:ABC transporter permease [Anaerovirgula multivorans]SNS87952.1 bacitracin transport system permease protein [Anaerovirgula multivorans]